MIRFSRTAKNVNAAIKNWQATPLVPGSKNTGAMNTVTNLPIARKPSANGNPRCIAVQAALIMRMRHFRIGITRPAASRAEDS